MTIKYRTHYFSDAKAKGSFERYAYSIFGLDFGRWKDRGLWDDQYIPFSAFVDGECIASICVFPSEITINGRREKWAQLLTVGTLPEYRLQGIQRELWERAHDWIKQHCQLTFLFTDDSAAGFYDKLGFKRPAERFDRVKYSSSSHSDMSRFRKLNVASDADFAILNRLAHSREPVSDRLGFENPNLLLFMLLYPHQEQLYYLEDMDIVVVAEDAGERLRVYDIIAERTPRLEDIDFFLSHFQKEEIEFMFCTDRHDVSNPQKIEVTDSILFVTDEFQLDGDFIFPATIRA
ncbi:hypothetical protein CEE37_07885 [candidate division LCP-89 bacterium B3_LCP]|uniref:N-acetyltransferase domain-containing protein n=1 Tax=candidate division LCP-89 bacterium B3_LCP TaxID=2012998 RepID=A0A532UZ68_UNCL8|nr:MAG: hypothetical protein CEE37_07885 [candidate division LCP-89 bacterium B3_LCP]